MKAYKIKVPDSAEIREYNSYYGSDIDAGITRAKIHELIQKKAVELGLFTVGLFTGKFSYDKKFAINQYVCFGFDIIAGTNNKETYDSWKAITISWHDFLKLTPEAVVEHKEVKSFFDTSGVPVPKEIPSMPDVKPPKNITDERKELAEKILLKLIEARHPDIDLGGFITEGNCKTHVTVAINYADEFLKQINQDKPAHV